MISYHDCSLGSLGLIWCINGMFDAGAYLGIGPPFLIMGPFGPQIRIRIYAAMIPTTVTGLIESLELFVAGSSIA